MKTHFNTPIHLSYLTQFSQEGLPAEEGRAILMTLSESGCLEDTVLEGISRFKEKFPAHEFERLDPTIIKVTAAIFAYDGRLSELARLRDLVKDCLLHDAFVAGRARGVYVRNHPNDLSQGAIEQAERTALDGVRAAESTVAQARLKLAQRPKNRAAVLAHE